MAMTKPALRILTAVPICDGHDSAINTINLELVRAGVEVVYLGYHRSARDMVRAAIQEDVAAIGISSYNGGGSLNLTNCTVSNNSTTGIPDSTVSHSFMNFSRFSFLNCKLMRCSKEYTAPSVSVILK